MMVDSSNLQLHAGVEFDTALAVINLNITIEVGGSHPMFAIGNLNSSPMLQAAGYCRKDLKGRGKLGISSFP